MNDTQDKTALLPDEDTPPPRSQTSLFGYRHRTVLLITAVVLLLLILEISFLPLFLLKCQNSTHSKRDIQPGEKDAILVSTTYKGQMTFYQPGLGSCGIQSTSKDLICAISKDLYGTPPSPPRRLSRTIPLAAAMGKP